MNFIFFGSDEFSVKVLETLALAGLSPTLIISAPNKPQGRKLVLTPPPVKIWAEKKNWEISQPSSLKKLDPQSPIWTKGKQADFALVASYGQIIPLEILNLPRQKTLNIHPSLLPKYRGPAPLETAILNGDATGGVTIIRLDEEMDHGPILAQEEIPLADQYDFITWRDTLAVYGAKLLLEKISDYLNGHLKPTPQDHMKATYTKKLIKADGQLDPTAPAIINYRKILALNPWPGTYLDFIPPSGEESKPIRLLIKKAHLENTPNQPNETKLIYDRVTPAGRPEMSWIDFLRGFSKNNKPA